MYSYKIIERAPETSHQSVVLASVREKSKIFFLNFFFSEQKNPKEVFDRDF